MKGSKKLYIPIWAVKTFVYVMVDLAVVFLSFLFAFFSLNGTIAASDFLFMAGATLFVVLFLSIFGAYKTITTRFSMIDAIQLGALVLVADAAVFVLDYFVFGKYCGVDRVDIFTAILTSVAQMAVIIATRCVTRIVRFFSNNGSGKRTAILGAGSAGKIAYDEMHNNLALNNNIVIFFDNDPGKIGKRYLGKKVYGWNERHEIIEKLKIQEVCIAISNLSKSSLKQIIEELSHENVVIKRLPILSEMDVDNVRHPIKEVSMAELLGRDEITFDKTGIHNFIQGKRVLVTGAGGSIGSELVTQIYESNPSRIVLFDIYENNVYDVQQNLIRRMKREGSEVELITIIGSTYNEERVDEIFEKYRPELVFHAAAYKHVPLMEDSPVEAIRTNVLGTYNVAKTANKYKSEKMTLVSTDKAVRPTNTMGATKSFAEMIIKYFDSISETTSYSAVRFGNVLGSNGSVIPLFKKQIEEGGPVTVTHKDIIRYFMTIPEAVSLILESATYANGGEIFILDMGEPVKIVTLAENVIRQAGYVPYKDIDIVFTGLRPGEKLYEELILHAKKHEETANKKIFVDRRKTVHPIEDNITYIRGALAKRNNDEIKAMLRTIVTNYTDYKEFNAAHMSEVREKNEEIESKVKEGIEG